MSSTIEGNIMKVTVIGAGNMGAAFVKQLSAAGHQVSVTSRHLDKAQALVRSY
jgi:8-hydroxy-5-deazaflavin:NADPH oxidoreductase